MAAIHRYEVPVDGRWHDVRFAGPVLHVASRQADIVELWAFSDGDTITTHRYQVFGTGHDLPDTALLYAGTALAPGGLVWHLMEAMAFGSQESDHA